MPWFSNIWLEGIAFKQKKIKWWCTICFCLLLRVLRVLSFWAYISHTVQGPLKSWKILSDTENSSNLYHVYIIITPLKENTYRENIIYHSINIATSAPPSEKKTLCVGLNKKYTKNIVNNGQYWTGSTWRGTA